MNVWRVWVCVWGRWIGIGWVREKEEEEVCDMLYDGVSFPKHESIHIALYTENIFIAHWISSNNFNKTTFTVLRITCIYVFCAKIILFISVYKTIMFASDNIHCKNGMISWFNLYSKTWDGQKLFFQHKNTTVTV